MSHHNEAQARYAKTPKGKLTQQRYNQTERGLMRWRRCKRRASNEADQRRLDALLNRKEPNAETDK